jgi:hypothetical protein
LSVVTSNELDRPSGPVLWTTPLPGNAATIFFSMTAALGAHPQAPQYSNVTERPDMFSCFRQRRTTSETGLMVLNAMKTDP